MRNRKHSADLYHLRFSKTEKLSHQPTSCATSHSTHPLDQSTKNKSPSIYSAENVCSRTYNRNFSFHLGLSVWGLTEVARMNLAGRAPPMLSLCSRTRPSFRLKLNLKLWCFRSFSWLPWVSGTHASERVRLGVSGWGEDGVAIGWMPSIQYGSLKPAMTNGARHGGHQRGQSHNINPKHVDFHAGTWCSNAHFYDIKGILTLWTFCNLIILKAGDLTRFWPEVRQKTLKQNILNTVSS